MHPTNARALVEQRQADLLRAADFRRLVADRPHRLRKAIGSVRLHRTARVVPLPIAGAARLDVRR